MPLPGRLNDCSLCGMEMLYWRDALFCVVCDNREDSLATWFARSANGP